jgi:hypothetical protein
MAFLSMVARRTHLVAKENRRKIWSRCNMHLQVPIRRLVTGEVLVEFLVVLVFFFSPKGVIRE